MHQEALLDIAIRVLIKRPGASLQDIAQAAGIGRTTLHRLFATREDLIHALLLSALTVVEQTTTESCLEKGTALEALERFIKDFVPLGHHFHFLLTERFDSEDSAIQTRMDYLQKQFEDLIRRGQQEGVFRTDLPVLWMLESLTALLFMAWESIHDGYTAPRYAPELVLTTLTQGIGKNV